MWYRNKSFWNISQSVNMLLIDVGETSANWEKLPNTCPPDKIQTCTFVMLQWRFVLHDGDFTLYKRSAKAFAAKPFIYQISSYYEQYSQQVLPHWQNYDITNSGLTNIIKKIQWITNNNPIQIKRHYDKVEIEDVSKVEVLAPDVYLYHCKQNLAITRPLIHDGFLLGRR